MICCVFRVKRLSLSSSGAVWTGRFKLEEDFDNKELFLRLTPHARRGESSQTLMHQPCTLKFKPNISHVDLSQLKQFDQRSFPLESSFTPNCQYIRPTQTMHYSCHDRLFDKTIVFLLKFSKEEKTQRILVD